MTMDMRAPANANAVTPRNRRRLPVGGWELALTGLLAAVVVGFGAAAPGFYTGPASLLGLTENFLPFGLVALGLSLVILTGGIDLSVGAVASLSAVLAAQLWSRFGVDIWAAAAVGVALGGVLGLVNAGVILRLGIEPLIATLGTSFLYGSAAVAAAGAEPPSGFPGGFTALGTGTVDGVLPASLAGLVPIQLVVFAAFAVLFSALVARSPFGRVLVMVGYSPDAARYSGIRTGRVLVTAYAVSGAMASLAGLVLASYYDAVRPDMGDVLLLTAITMVVLGGVSIFGGEGTVAGVVVSVLVLGFLRQGMLIAGFSDMVTTMLTGAILLASIAVKNLFNRRGTGLANQIWAMIRRPEPPRANPS
ncbi:ABC transporter permease [Lichenibacterium ramalinae]|uniref:Autoinducer 2 import system permease protein LsrD n=2 Tax=Lichenibacterium ramalinae TaxID=2316527 RepID=A0A4Q2R930_9HYPH|nr:ABC transporter permease [Lichenibacterium ramalinae]